MADDSKLAFPTATGKARVAQLENFAAHLESISADIGFKVSARGWAYILEQAGLITKADFDRVEELVNELRRGGYLPVDFVAEEAARSFAGVEVPETESPTEYLASYLETSLRAGEIYTPNWWKDEEYYVQMVVEKIDLKTLFEPVCADFHIPISSSKGWSSILQRAEYARRFKEAEDEGLRCALLYCVPEGTPIIGLNGHYPVEEVCVGDVVLGSRNAVRVLRRFKRRYTGQLAEIRATSMLPLHLTPNHPVRVARVEKNPDVHGLGYRTIAEVGWKNAGDVRPGDYVEVSQYEQRQWSQTLHIPHLSGSGENKMPAQMLSGKLELTPELAQLFGCYLGDGSYSGSPTLTLGSSQPDLIETYAEIIRSELGYDPGFVEDGGAVQLRFGGTVLGRFLTEMFGRYSHYKRIPDFILHAPTPHVSAFLQGYYDSDGHRSEKPNRPMRFSTCSQGLALQVQQLVLSRYSELPAVFYSARAGPMKINGREAFQTDKYEVHVYSQTLQKIFGTEYSGIRGRREWLRRNGITYVPVNRVASVPFDGHVYNLTTTDHTFSVRNITTHNCGDHDADGLRISDFLRSNLVDVADIRWEDGTQGYDPSDLTIFRFGLNYDFIEQHGLIWIDNLITGSRRDLASPSHKNHHLPYVQDYLANYGARKCEANALVVNPKAGRELCRAAIERYLGTNAKARFQKRRKEVLDRLKDFDGLTNYRKALQEIIEKT